MDTNFYLPTDLLVKVDITSMAHALEVRSPLLDREPVILGVAPGVQYLPGATESPLPQDGHARRG